LLTCQNCCSMYTAGNMLKQVISLTNLTDDRYSSFWKAEKPCNWLLAVVF